MIVCALALVNFLSTISAQDRLAISEFSDCVKSGLPCGWERFKSASGVRLQRDSLGIFVAIQSVRDVQAIDRRIHFESSDFPILCWRWRVHTLPEAGKEDVRKRNDCAAAVYIAFKGMYPFNHVIKYAWSTTMPVGSIVPSPFGKNVRIFVIRSGSERRNEWISEKRNFKEDYRKVFGDSAPPVEAVALQTDSDNTETSASADYADVFASKH